MINFATVVEVDRGTTQVLTYRRPAVLHDATPYPFNRGNSSFERQSIFIITLPLQHFSISRHTFSTASSQHQHNEAVMRLGVPEKAWHKVWRYELDLSAYQSNSITDLEIVNTNGEVSSYCLEMYLSLLSLSDGSAIHEGTSFK